MGYEPFISHNAALFDLPLVKYGQTVRSKGQNQPKGKNYFEEIFRKLLVFDQIPDNDFNSVIEEVNYFLASEDPAFEPVTSRAMLEDLFAFGSAIPKWQKISQDFRYYLVAETKRRNRANPYHPRQYSVSEIEELPNFAKQRPHQPWQFDSLYKDATRLADQISELTKNYQEKKDKDLFRAKINSILVAEKIIFALDSGDNIHDLQDNEIYLANLKLNLDGYKLAYGFAQKVLESLHKMKWNYSELANQLDLAIDFADNFLEKLANRIDQVEKRFLLFYNSLDSNEE